MRRTSNTLGGVAKVKPQKGTKKFTSTCETVWQFSFVPFVPFCG
jgi:hypothetical protein